MKRKQRTIIASSFSFLSLVVLCLTARSSHETKLFLRMTETLSRAEEPGTQGHRVTQLVQCNNASSFIFVPGCCLGSEECYNMNPCKGNPFSCDGDIWIEPE